MFSNVNIRVPRIQGMIKIFPLQINFYSFFRDIENELMLVATHFLKSATQQKSTNSHYQTQNNTQNVDLEYYGLRNIDRFAVLYDLWECEERFQQKKRQLLDCYLEAYHHVTGTDATKLAQVPNSSALLLIISLLTQLKILLTLKYC